MRSTLSSLYKIGLNCLSPPFCAYCKKWLTSRTALCAICFDKIKPIISADLRITKRYSMKIFACSSYCDPLKSLILAKGWSDIVSSRQLGELIWQLTNVNQSAFDYLIPIPLHWSRFAKRGFNQAEEIATILARKNGKPVINLLRRIKRTPFQFGLSLKGRRNNVCDAFEINYCDSDVYKNKHLVLVDDLMTTGSTLRAAAQMLLRYKPASISAIVACRVV